MDNEQLPFQPQPIAEHEKRLIETFDDLEKHQLEFLDEGGKRIIELTTLLLGLLIGIATLGDEFPPAFLKNNVLGRVFTLAALVLYLGAMFMAMLCVQPRRYERHNYNLTFMREELDRIMAYKMRALWWAGALFCLASASLVLLFACVF